MQRLHTYATISQQFSKQKRTVQLWHQKAVKDGQDLGELVNGVRYFSDSERAILLTYGDSKESSFIKTSELAVVSRSEINLPESFDPVVAMSKFDGVVGQATDPDQIVALCQLMLDSAEENLDQKVGEQRVVLKQHEAALEKVREMKQDKVVNLKIKASESRMLADLQTTTTTKLQKEYSDIANLGKS